MPGDDLFPGDDRGVFAFSTLLPGRTSFNDIIEDCVLLLEECEPACDLPGDNGSDAPRLPPYPGRVLYTSRKTANNPFGRNERYEIK